MVAKFRRLEVPSGSYVPPNGETWPFTNYEYINKDPAGGDRAPMDTNITGSQANNIGSFFVAFQDGASSSFANRPHWALAMNTDILDDLVHRPVAVMKSRTAISNPNSSSISVTSGFVWTGDATDAVPDDFVKITMRGGVFEGRDVRRVDGVLGYQVRNKCIDIQRNGGSILGLGMWEATAGMPITFVFEGAVAADVWLYYATRDSVATMTSGTPVRHLFNPSKMDAGIWRALELIRGDTTDPSTLPESTLFDLRLAGTTNTDNEWELVQKFQEGFQASSTQSLSVPIMDTLSNDVSALGGNNLVLRHSFSNQTAKWRLYGSADKMLMVSNAYLVFVGGVYKWHADDGTKPAYMMELSPTEAGRKEYRKFITTAEWVMAGWDSVSAATLYESRIANTLALTAITGDDEYHPLLLDLIGEPLTLSVPSFTSGANTRVECCLDISMSNAGNSSGDRVRYRIEVSANDGASWGTLEGSTMHEAIPSAVPNVVMAMRRHLRFVDSLQIGTYPAMKFRIALAATNGSITVDTDLIFSVRIYV